MKKFAIVGCGNIAKRHAENILRVGELVAVCDIVPGLGDAMANTYGVNAYNSIDDLLKSEAAVDIVCICTPNGYHAEHIIKSLQAGRDVLTEKPLCLTKAAACQIIETEKFCRRKLFVVKSARYNPILKELKSLLTQNRLGQVYSFHLSCIWNRPETYYNGWKGKLFPDGGTLYNQFSHYLDAALWLFGEVQDVKAFTANAAHQSSVEFEDTGAASLLLQNGTIGSIHWTINAFQKNYEIGLHIMTEKATIKIGGEYLNEVQYLQSTEPIALTSFAKESVNSHQELYDHLLDALSDDNHNFPDAFDGLRTVETIEKIYKASS